MRSFDPIFTQILRHEGYFANLSGDKGGMTYAGIARNFNPSWYGWRIVDSAITKNGGLNLPNNYRINDATLDQYVRDFYLEKWRKSMAGNIRNQQIAHLYFDFYIHSGKAVREVQEVLLRLGHRIAVDNIPGPQTIGAINSHADQAALHDAIKAHRISYLHEISKYGSNANFLPGWLARLADFPALSMPSKNTTIVVGSFLALVITGYMLYKKKQIRHI